MFAKPFNLALVYVVTVLNYVLLFSPFLAIALPFMKFQNHVLTIEYDIFQKIKLGFCVLAFLVSFLMLVYLVLDFLFGFSVRASLKGCSRHEKLKEYDFLTGIFDQVKTKFAEKNVKLYIKDSDEVNAYAISSIGSKAMVLTRGIVNHYLVECPDPKNFLSALRSIMGHEMSHLINKDFLPTFLIINNQKMTNFISHILFIIFNVGVRTSRLMPYGGRFMANLISDTYSILSFILTSFNRFVVYNIYEFLRRSVSRSIEYRCDRQSALAFGGRNMALALSMLGESGYFTLFSTHPRTKARMNKVENIKITDSVILPRFFDSVANYFSLIMLVVICLYFAKQAHVDYALRQYIQNHETINRKLVMLWHLVSRFF